MLLSVAGGLVWLMDRPMLAMLVLGVGLGVLGLFAFCAAIDVWQSGVIEADARRWWSACLTIYRSNLTRQYLMGLVMLGGVTLFAGFMGSFLAKNLAELAVLLANWVP